MIRQLKTITVNMVAGANIATAVTMLLVGFSDYAYPPDHPYVATAGLLFPAFLLANMAFLFFWLIFKRRMVLIPVAGYLAAFAPLRIYMPVNPPADPPAGAVKVMSYNVQAFNSEPEGNASYERIMQYIEQSKADIVCLQENLYAGRDAKQRFDSIYAYTDTTLVGTGRTNALGIYTRFPILRKERISYESAGNGSVAYYLRMGADTVIVINNHFESNHLSPDERKRYKDILKGDVEKDTARAESKRLLHKLGDAAKRRAPQADSVHNYIKSHSRYPIIVCGDFNDNPISYTRRVVAKGLTDCYVATGRGIGLSYNQKGFFVRIDNILCSGHFKPYNCKVDNKINASDHYPIICWLKKRGKQ